MTNKQTSNVSDVIEDAVDEIGATSAPQPIDYNDNDSDSSINHSYTTQEEDEEAEEVDDDSIGANTAKESTQNDSEYVESPVESPVKSKLPLYASIGCGVALIAVAGALLVPKLFGANDSESPVNTKTATEQQAVVSTPPVATDPAVTAAALAGIPPVTPPVTADPAPSTMTTAPLDAQPPVTGAAVIGSPAGTTDSTGIPPVGMPPVGTTPVAQSAPTSAVPATSVAPAVAPSVAPTPAVAATTKATATTVTTTTAATTTAATTTATPEGVVVFKTPSCEASFDAAKNGDTKCGYTIYKQTKSPKSSIASTAPRKNTAQAKSNLKAKTKTKVITKKKAKEPVTKPITKRSASYSLYAAQGGRIWLSQSGSETDGTGVKSYVVGDILPNGAKIVSITQPDGSSRKTKVKTTQGWISD